MKSFYYRQGDILYFEFGPTRDNEIRGVRPAVVISNDSYNRNTNYLIVVPVTTGGTKFDSYVELRGYRNVHGRANASQIYSYSVDRAKSLAIDHLTLRDFNEIKRKLKNSIC